MARALIPNSTQVPDIILDQWMAELSGAEFKVLLYVARRTYGFGKDADTISLNQLAHGIRRKDGSVVDRGTGLSRSGVKSACVSLIEKGVLIRTGNTAKDGREPEESTYRLNLFAALTDDPDDEGGVGQNSAQVGQKLARVGQESAGGRPDSDRGVGQNLALQETDQETDQETAPEGDAVPADPDRVAADAFLVEELVRHGVGRRTAAALARAKPAVCRRCLEYLPFAKVKTSTGAWLANAIRDEYGPPEGYLKAESAKRTSAGKPQGSPALARREAIDSRVGHAYAQLERTQPRAFAAFTAHVASERERAERFAAGLSERRRHEYLASFETEEHRLRLFGRWVTGKGRGVVVTAPAIIDLASAADSLGAGA